MANPSRLALTDIRIGNNNRRPTECQCLFLLYSRMPLPARILLDDDDQSACVAHSHGRLLLFDAFAVLWFKAERDVAILKWLDVIPERGAWSDHCSAESCTGIIYFHVPKRHLSVVLDRDVNSMRVTAERHDGESKVEEREMKIQLQMNSSMRRVLPKRSWDPAF